MEKATKTQHSLDLPYPILIWPILSTDAEDHILELLCQLLQPIGGYHKHAPISEGRGHKRRAVGNDKGKRGSAVYRGTPPPAIFGKVTVGFNSTVKRLEEMSNKSRPISHHQKEEEPDGKTFKGNAQEGEEYSRLAVVYVCYSTLSPMLTSSLPMLVATASLADPERPPIRLVQLSRKGEDKLIQALHIPRVGIVGLEESAVGAGPLVDFIQQHVKAIDIPWLRDATKYLPVEIKTKESTVGTKIKPGNRIQSSG